MKTIHNIIAEAYSEYINEAGLIVNKNDEAYPNSNQILIMAGGAGSGKSFILDKLILFDGKILNIDYTTELLLKLGRKNPNSQLAKTFKKDMGKELRDINLKDAEDVSLIHDFLSLERYDYKKYKEKPSIQKTIENIFFRSTREMSQKSSELPNVVFDIQMKTGGQVRRISKLAEYGGYDKKNIHIVWVLNDFNIALKQNKSRERTIKSDYLRSWHTSVAKTFDRVTHEIDSENGYEGLAKYVDGDIWIVFNKKGIDISTKTTYHRDEKTGKEYSRIHIDDNAEHPYFAVHMKERGKPAKKWNEIDKAVINKILDYVPEEAKEYIKY